jgi:hypothetical protein
LTGGQTSVALDPQRNIYVSQLAANGRYSTFAPLMPFPKVAPGAVTGLKVAGKKTARKRLVTWAPGPAGTALITSYVVTVRKGAKTKVTATTALPSYQLKVKLPKKRPHHH